MEFQIHPAANAFPMMDDCRYAELLEDIRENGQLELITLCDGKILDGRNRYKAVTELGLAPKTRDYEGDPWQFAWSLNGQRRDLPDMQRAAIKRIIDRSSSEWQAEQAKLAAQIMEERNKKISEAASAGLIGRASQSLDVVPKEQHLNEVRAKGRATRAAAANVSSSTQAKVEWIESKRPDLLEKVASGEMKGADAIREMKRSEIVEHLENVEAVEAKAVLGVYDVIVLDPPWPMEKIERDVTPEQVAFDYPVMSEEDMAALKIPAADDCHVWVWTTHKFLPMAMRLLTAWNFKYVCTFVWHKPGGFQPYELPQFNCEFALYARKGTPKFIDTKAFPVCFNAPRGAHSAKPEEFYDVVRRVTAGRRLDMFNRRRIEGFDGWGKEAEQ